MIYSIHLLVYFDIYLIVALGLELIVGRCGLLTVAHAGYFAIGAYTYAILALRFGFGVLPATAGAVAVAMVLSLLVSLPSWKLGGDFFFLESLAVQALIYSLLSNLFTPTASIGTWKNLTNGPFGITTVPPPRIFGHILGQRYEFPVFATVTAVVVTVAIRRMEASPWGRLLLAMRDDELVLRGLGKNTRIVKVQAFVIATTCAAIGGVLYACDIRYVDPSISSLDESIFLLSVVIVGGLGASRGPIVGAALLLLVPEALRFLNLPDAQAANIRLMLYGLMLILLMHFRPHGVAGSATVRTATTGS